MQEKLVFNGYLSLSVVSRINRVKILEHLLGVWSMDRKVDWSVWVVHSKMEVPNHYLRNGSNESSHHNITGKVAVRKANDEVFVLTVGAVYDPTLTSSNVHMTFNKLTECKVDILKYVF